MNRTRVALIATSIVATAVPVLATTASAQEAPDAEICYEQVAEHRYQKHTQTRTRDWWLITWGPWSDYGPLTPWTDPLDWGVVPDPLSGDHDGAEGGMPLPGNGDDRRYEYLIVDTRTVDGEEIQCPTTTTEAPTTTTEPPPPPNPNAEVICVSTGPDYVSWQVNNTGEVDIVAPVSIPVGGSTVIEELRNSQGTAMVVVTFADESTLEINGSGEGCVFTTVPPTTTPAPTPPPTTAPPVTSTPTTVAPTTDPPVTTVPVTEPSAPTTTVVAPFDPEAELPATR